MRCLLCYTLQFTDKTKMTEKSTEDKKCDRVIHSEPSHEKSGGNMTSSKKKKKKVNDKEKSKEIVSMAIFKIIQIFIAVH